MKGGKQMLKEALDINYDQLSELDFKLKETKIDKVIEEKK